MKPARRVVIDATTVWVACPECDGDEGYCDVADNWVPCPACEGDGGSYDDTTDEERAAFMKTERQS